MDFKSFADNAYTLAKEEKIPLAEAISRVGSSAQDVIVSFKPKTTYELNLSGSKNVMGLNGAGWDYYWQALKNYKDFDIFYLSSADSSNHINKNFIEFSGLDIKNFSYLIANQSLLPISMGCYDVSRFVQDTTTNSVYLQIPQTGFGAFFKLTKID